MTEHRVPAGVPTGGQFTAADRPEPRVALEVEFSADEAEQVENALSDHTQAILRDAADERVARRAAGWSPEARAAMDANAAARAQVSLLRTHLSRHPRPGQFARRTFFADEVAAMGNALEFRRRRVIAAAGEEARGGRWPEEARTALNATEAALFRLDIAEPIVKDQPA